MIRDLFYFSLCLSCRLCLSPNASRLALAHMALQRFCDETADRNQNRAIADYLQVNETGFGQASILKK